MPRKKKRPQPKKKRKLPRIHSYKEEQGHILYADSKTTTVDVKRLNFPSVGIPLLFLVGLASLILYVAYLNKSLSFVAAKPQINNQNVQRLPVITTPQLKEGVEKPQFTARGIYAYDLKTNTVLYSKNENSPLLPASTTKMATALVGLLFYKPDDVLTVTQKTYGQTMGLVIGEKITFENLLKGLLIYSANDAAETIAANYPGDGAALPAGRQGFILAMNKFVEDKGLLKTHFTNPVGFDEYLHFSTPSDMAKLASIGLQNETFSKIVSTQILDVQNIDGTITHHLVNTNQLLGKVDGVIGVKTGHTTTSGESLVTLVDRNGHKVLISMLGSTDRFGETTKLIEWIYSNYNWPEN